ncbi:MAG: hypothetical protein FWC97_02240 [Treponema sp.]|nr:hypothetical protein [Treponema sp.]
MQRTKKAKRYILAGFVVFAAILLVLGACGPDPSPPPPPPPQDITWTLEQVGGVNFEATTTGLQITFGSRVNNLTSSDITVTGVASVGSGAFESSQNGAVWTIPIDVTEGGLVTVEIPRSGIETGPQSVSVFFVGEWTPATWTATANGTAGVSSTTAILFVFDHFDDFNSTLNIADFVITNGTGSIEEAVHLIGSGNEWSLTVRTESAGTVKVVVNHENVVDDYQFVTVHYRPNVLSPEAPRVNNIQDGLHFVPDVDLTNQTALDTIVGNETHIRANISFTWLGLGADTFNIYWANEAIRPAAPGATGIVDQVFFINNLEMDSDYFFWIEAVNQHGRVFSDVYTRSTRGVTATGPGDTGRQGARDITYFGLERGDYVREMRIEPSDGTLTVMWDLRDRVGWYEVYVIPVGEIAHIDRFARRHIPVEGSTTQGEGQWGFHVYADSSPTNPIGIHSWDFFNDTWRTFHIGANNGMNLGSGGRPVIGMNQLGTPDAIEAYQDPFFLDAFPYLGEGWEEGEAVLAAHARQGVNVGLPMGLGWLQPYTVLDSRFENAIPWGPDPITGVIGAGAPGSEPRPHFSTNITITGLTNGTTYQVWIRAPNVHGERGYTYMNATPGPVALPMVQNVTVTAPPNTVRNLDIAWDRVENATHYRLYFSRFNRPPRPQDEFTRVTGTVADPVFPNRLSQAVSGLLPDTLYYAFVVAESGGVGGAIGSAVTGRTGMAPASGIMRPKFNLDASGNPTTQEIRTLVYVEVNDDNPLNAGSYILDDGTFLFNYVVLFAANLRIRNCAAETLAGAPHGCMKNGPHVHFNENVRFILNNRARYVQPLQDKGIKVLLGLLGDWDGISFGTMVDWMRPDVSVDQVIAEFIEDVRREVEAFGLDGVDFDDEWANKADFPPGASANTDMLPTSVIAFPAFTAAWPFNYTIWRNPDVGIEAGNFLTAAPADAAITQMWQEGGAVFLRVLEAARVAMPNAIIALYEFGHSRHITSGPGGTNPTDATVTIARLEAAIDYAMQPWYNQFHNASPNALPRSMFSPIAIDVGGGAYADQAGRPNPPFPGFTWQGNNDIATFATNMRNASNAGNPYGFMFFYGLNPSSIGLSNTANGARNRTKEEYISYATRIIFGMDTILTSEGGDFRREW